MRYSAVACFSPLATTDRLSWTAEREDSILLWWDCFSSQALTPCWVCLTKCALEHVPIPSPTSNPRSWLRNGKKVHHWKKSIPDHKWWLCMEASVNKFRYSISPSTKSLGMRWSRYFGLSLPFLKSRLCKMSDFKWNSTYLVLQWVHKLVHCPVQKTGVQTPNATKEGEW